MKNVRGFSLIELMIATAIGGVLSLVMATFFAFAAEQFYSLIDQNEAEQSILLTSYYLRFLVSQGVKIMQGSAAVNFTGNPEPTAYPQGVAVGYFDTTYQCADANCNAMTNPWPVGWPAGNITPMAYFIREAGGSINPADPTVIPVSNYIVTGLFFIPPLAQQAGRVYLGQLPPTGGTFTLTDASMSNQYYFDRLVAFGLSVATAGQPFTTGTAIAALPAPNSPMASVSFFIRARYFKGTSSVRDYSSDPAAAAAAGAFFSDITSVVNVSFRDNVVGTNLTGTNQNERPDNGLYFYQFTSPPLQEF